MRTRACVETLRLHIVVLRCQAGDEQAFDQLFGWFGPRTLRYLRNVVGPAAEDVQQDVWLSVYRGLGALANPQSFGTWIFRIARHRAIDHLRERKRERDLLAEVDRPTDELLVDTDEDARTLELIERCLGELAPIHREALVLRYWEDLTYAEIAQVVGCSLGTIRSRLHYATRRMRQLIDIDHLKHAREVV